MPTCVAKGCRNSTSTHNKRNGITFHMFPQDPVQTRNWTRAIRLERGENDWNPTATSRICSVHFDERYINTTKKGLRRLHAKAFPIFPGVEFPPGIVLESTSNSQNTYQPTGDWQTGSINSYLALDWQTGAATSQKKANKTIAWTPSESSSYHTSSGTTQSGGQRSKSKASTTRLSIAKKLMLLKQKEVSSDPTTPTLLTTCRMEKSTEQSREARPSRKKTLTKLPSSPQKTFVTLSDDDVSQAKSEPGESPGRISDSDSDDELLKPKEELDSDKEGSASGKTFSFQLHYLYRNAVNLVESPSGAAVVDSSRSSKCCVVPDCRAKNRRLFDLPKDSEHRNAWLELLPWLPDGTGVAEVLLCSEHFSRDYLSPMGLHVDAVPTMSLPDPLSDAWPAQEGRIISNDVITTSAKPELGERSPRTLTTLVNASTVGDYRNDFTTGQLDTKGFGQMGVNMQPRILLETLPVDRQGTLRSKDDTDQTIKIEPELQENPSLYPASITPAPNIKVQSFFQHPALADYMQPNTSSSSFSVGPNLNVPSSNNLSFVIQPMEAKPTVHGSWEVPLSVTNSPPTASMGPPGKKTKPVVIKKASQVTEPQSLKRVRVKRRKSSSSKDEESVDIGDGLEIGEVRIATPVTKKAAKICADDLPLARYISAPCILCEGKCKFKLTMSRQDLKAKIFKCFGIKLIANFKFEMCEGCLSQLKNAEYFRTKVHIVNETIIKDDIMNRKVGDPPLETEEPVKPVPPQLFEKHTQTIVVPEIYDPKDLSNFRILFDEEVDPKNLVDNPSFLRMSSDIYRDGLSLCKKRILIMTEKQPVKLPPVLENTSFPQKFQPPYENSEFQKFQPAFESAYKKPSLPPPPLPVEDMYKRDSPAVDYAFKKFQPFFEQEKKVIPPMPPVPVMPVMPPQPPPPAPPVAPKPKKARVKPIQVEKPLCYTEGRPPTRMGRKPNLTKVYVCKICHERFLEIQLLKTHIEGHKAAGEQKSNIPAPASRPNPNLYHPGTSREFGHIDHHR